MDRTACWHREVLETAKSNLTAAQKKQKQHYERKHSKPGSYQVGIKVLMKDFTRKKKGEKLDPKRLGPYSLNMHFAKVVTGWTNVVVKEPYIKQDTIKSVWALVIVLALLLNPFRFHKVMQSGRSSRIL